MLIPAITDKYPEKKLIEKKERRVCVNSLLIRLIRILLVAERGNGDTNENPRHDFASEKEREKERKEKEKLVRWIVSRMAGII